MHVVFLLCLINWIVGVLSIKCWAVNYSPKMISASFKVLILTAGVYSLEHNRCSIMLWRMIEWVTHPTSLPFYFFFQAGKRLIYAEKTVYKKNIPRMTLILFKCVPAARQDFMSISSTACLLNITARFSWQVPFTSHIPRPERISPCEASFSQSRHK